MRRSPTAATGYGRTASPKSATAPARSSSAAPGSGLGQVVSPEFAGTMNEMLSAVIGHGTGSSAALPRPAAGKTGTTQDYRDAWFIGYTADLVAGVWLGNDDNTPMNKVTGSSLPAEAWRRFMLAATRAMPVRPLPAGPPPPTSVLAAAPRARAPAFSTISSACSGRDDARPLPHLAVLGTSPAAGG